MRIHPHFKPTNQTKERDKTMTNQIDDYDMSRAHPTAEEEQAAAVEELKRLTAKPDRSKLARMLELERIISGVGPKNLSVIEQAEIIGKKSPVAAARFLRDQQTRG